MRFTILALIFSLITLSKSEAQSLARDDSDAAKLYEKEYKKNIKLSKINGVYIPSSVEEALERLEKLSPPASIAKFSSGEEVSVSEKLHFGIGRWMIANWNFYGGSRLSHLLKSKGVVHPDDMAQYLLRSLHRKLNGNPMEEKLLIEELSMARKKLTQDVLGYQRANNR